MSCSCNSCLGETFPEVFLQAKTNCAICEEPPPYPCSSFVFEGITDWYSCIAAGCISCGTLYESGGIIAQNFASGEPLTIGAACDQLEGEWRIAFQPPITCYLKVWYETRTEVFIMGVGSPTTVGDTYEWIGTGNPCITLPDDEGIDSGPNLEYSTPVIEGLPASDTRVCVRIVKYSFLPDYEPDISDPLNPQPNGYPSPTWEPLPP